MKKSLKLLFSMFVLLAASQAFAQRAGNGEVKDATPPDPNSVGTPRASGGPDAFGYTWDDAVPYDMIDITINRGVIILNDGADDVGVSVNLGGNDFTFYGTPYSAITMTSNGYLSTDPSDNGPDISNDCPLPASPSTGGGARIYPLHDDFVVSGSGWYEYFALCPRPADIGANGGCHVFLWASLRHFGDQSVFWVETILYVDSGEIVCMIGPGNPELGSGSTTGIQDDGATSGLTYACDTGSSIADSTVVAFFPPAGAATSEVPTMSEYGMMGLVILILGSALFFIRRKN